MLDYGSTHPNSNVPQNNSRGPGNFDYESMGGQDITAGRLALRWTPSDAVEINLSGDYTREDSEAIPVVLLAAGAICSAPACTTFDPRSTGDSNSLSAFPPPTYQNPWLRGKNGQPVNVSCAFVPAGPYSCDTGGNLLGYDPRYVSYSNFMTAVGNFVAGKIGEATGGESGEMSKELTLSIYNQIGWVTIFISVVVLALSPLVKKWMHLDTLQDRDLAGQGEVGEPQAAGIHPAAT